MNYGLRAAIGTAVMFLFGLGVGLLWEGNPYLGLFVTVVAALDVVVIYITVRDHFGKRER